jgi:hypothetical protein
VETAILGRGWPFPITPGPLGRLSFLGGPDKIRQSIWLILSTAPGERQMLPEFGCGIHDLVFQVNSAALRGLVQGKPRNYLLIRIDYRVRTSNAFYNLVYPLFINEGAG